MEVEGGNPVEETELIQVLVNRQRRDLPDAFDERRAQSVLI
jgi:hypothetical protein